MRVASIHHLPGKFTAELSGSQSTHGCCGCNAKKGRVKIDRCLNQLKKRKVIKCTEHYQIWTTVRDKKTFVEWNRKYLQKKKQSYIKGNVLNTDEKK